VFSTISLKREPFSSSSAALRMRKLIPMMSQAAERTTPIWFVSHRVVEDVVVDTSKRAPISTSRGTVLHQSAAVHHQRRAVERQSHPARAHGSGVPSENAASEGERRAEKRGGRTAATAGCAV
jgi:ABC-type thiamine transport system ATPase subunit